MCWWCDDEEGDDLIFNGNEMSVDEAALRVRKYLTVRACGVTLIFVSFISLLGSLSHDACEHEPMSWYSNGSLFAAGVIYLMVEVYEAVHIMCVVGFVKGLVAIARDIGAPMFFICVSLHLHSLGSKHEWPLWTAFVCLLWWAIAVAVYAFFGASEELDFDIYVWQMIKIWKNPGQASRADSITDHRRVRMYVILTSLAVVVVLGTPSCLKLCFQWGGYWIFYLWALTLAGGGGVIMTGVLVLEAFRRCQIIEGCGYLGVMYLVGSLLCLPVFLDFVPTGWPWMVFVFMPAMFVVCVITGILMVVTYMIGKTRHPVELSLPF